MRPSRAHRDVPVRSAFSAIECKGRREAKRLMTTTTVVDKRVSSRSELVSTGVRLPPRDAPSPSLSSTDDEVACLMGLKENVRPAPLHRPPLAPPPSARSRSHRSSRSSVSRASHFTFTSQHSLLDINVLVRDVLHQTAQIEERRTQAEQQRLQVAARAEQEQLQVERDRLQAERPVEERRIQAEQHRIQAMAQAERDRI